MSPSPREVRHWSRGPWQTTGEVISRDYAPWGTTQVMTHTSAPSRALKPLGLSSRPLSTMSAPWSVAPALDAAGAVPPGFSPLPSPAARSKSIALYSLGSDMQSSHPGLATHGTAAQSPGRLGEQDTSGGCTPCGKPGFSQQASSSWSEAFPLLWGFTTKLFSQHAFSLEPTPQRLLL
jgi:hypothetical protein